MNTRKQILVMATAAIIALVFVLTACLLEPEPETKTFTITFDADNGSAPTTLTVTEGDKATEPKGVTKNGYTLDGWYKEAAFTNKWNFAADTVTADITLHAKWIEQEQPKAQSTVYNWETTAEKIDLTITGNSGITVISGAYTMKITIKITNDVQISTGTASGSAGSITFAPKSNPAKPFTLTITTGSDGAISVEVPSGTTIVCEGGDGISIPQGNYTGTQETAQVPLRSEISIGIVMPDTATERWAKDGAALYTAALEKGYMVESPIYTNDQNEQNMHIQTLMNNGAKLIIVGNINTGIADVIPEAKQKGVTIIAYDRLIQETGDYGYYLTFNNYKVGEIMGQSIIDALASVSAGPKNIALFAGDPQNDKNAEFFFSGAWDKLKDKGYTIIDGNTISDAGIPGWDPANVKDRMDRIFNNNTIDAVLAPNDYVARYIIEHYPSFTGIITGQDADFGSASYIKDGKQYMTVFKDTRILANAAVELADRILQKQPINDIDGVIFATGDLAEMGNNGVKKVETYLADPKVITKDNLNDLLGIGWFTPEQEAQLGSDAHRWSHHWSKWVDPTSTATLVYSIDGDGVCTITVGGTAVTPDWDRWKAQALCSYTATANTSYEYTFEAWTASGEGNRTLNIQYYSNSPADARKNQDITETRTTYTIQGESIPNDGFQNLEFRCADQTGTFYMKMLSITEYTQ